MKWTTVVVGQIVTAAITVACAARIITAVSKFANDRFDSRFVCISSSDSLLRIDWR
jgi:hypothetical protein